MNVVAIQLFNGFYVVVLIYQYVRIVTAVYSNKNSCNHNRHKNIKSFHIIFYFDQVMVFMMTF